MLVALSIIYTWCD